jgi:hypothetical protein
MPAEPAGAAGAAEGAEAEAEVDPKEAKQAAEQVVGPARGGCRNLPRGSRASAPQRGQCLSPSPLLYLSARLISSYDMEGCAEGCGETKALASAGKARRGQEGGGRQEGAAGGGGGGGAGGRGKGSASTIARPLGTGATRTSASYEVISGSVPRRNARRPAVRRACTAAAATSPRMLIESWMRCVPEALGDNYLSAPLSGRFLESWSGKCQSSMAVPKTPSAPRSPLGRLSA